MQAKTLRTLARGQPCFVRLTGICNYNPETTVLAHIRRGNTAGMGQKPSDLCAVFACSACHDALDGRTNVARSEIDGDVLAALCRQLAYYDQHEIVRVLL